MTSSLQVYSGYRRPTAEVLRLGAMWRLPLNQSIDELMRMRLDTSHAVLKVARSVMYSDAGFDVSRCGRYLALCELDPQARRARARPVAAAAATPRHATH